MAGSAGKSGGIRRVGGSAEVPAAHELVALARRRLADELSALPEWKSPAFWWRLRSRDPAGGVSLGVHVHYIRRAAGDDDGLALRELFTLLIERVERQNQRWAARVVERTPALRGEAAAAARDDLMQDIALHLWERVCRGGDEWELFFSRALEFAQRHVAASYMRKRGLWARPGVRRSHTVLAYLVESLSAFTHDQDGARTDEPIAATAPLAAAELSDLRQLVLALPLPERIAIVLRFWQGASEQEIAAALGGVTTRTVRNRLRRAYDLLRAAYQGAEVRG